MLSDDVEWNFGICKLELFISTQAAAYEREREKAPGFGTAGLAAAPR